MSKLDMIRHAALRWTLRTLMRPGRRRGQLLKLKGLRLEVPAHVSHPRPAPLLHLMSLFQQSAQEVEPGAKALEMGAGAGVWSALCVQRGAEVTASDLPGVSLAHLERSTQGLSAPPVELCEGDLFSGLQVGRRFEHIFFNPPFHLATAEVEWERAYFGGSGGEVVTRFLAEAPRWLSQTGVVWICLPDRERARYHEHLSAYRIELKGSRWLPLLGRVRLIALRPHGAPLCEGERLGLLSPVAESFWHLSRLMNTHSAELLTVKGRLSEERLAGALEEVCARHPLTTARLSLRGLKRPEWRAGPPCAPSLEVLTLPEGSTGFQGAEGRWRGPLPEVLRRLVWESEAIDPIREPPARFVLLWEGGLSHLMVIAPHLCTDAHAGALLLSELLESYGDANLEERALAPAPLMVEDPLSLSHLPPLKRATLALIGLKRLLRDLITRGSGVSEVSGDGDRGRTLLTVSSRDPEELSRALKVAKRAGLTAHVLFTKALMNRERAQREARHSSLRLADLIALAPLYPEPRRAALMCRFDVLVLPHVVNHDLTAPLEGYQADFKEVLTRLKAGEALAELYRLRFYNALARLLPIRFMSGLLFRFVLKTTTTTTNPGPVRAPLERCGPHEVLDFINFPQLSPPARLGVIYSTFRGRLRLMILHDEAKMSHQAAERFAEELWAEVMSLTDTLDAQSSA